jgi:hypothetical protein
MLEVVNFVVWALIATGGLNLIGFAITGKFLWTSLSTSLFGPALGVALGRFLVAYRIVHGLLKIDKRKADLENDIAIIRGQLNREVLQKSPQVNATRDAGNRSSDDPSPSSRPETQKRQPPGTGN